MDELVVLASQVVAYKFLGWSIIKIMTNNENSLVICIRQNEIGNTNKMYTFCVL